MKIARILIVDDAKFTRDLMVKAVKAEYPKFEVEVAQDGRKAQGMLGRARYDLVLCDWEMPEMSGIELLTWLREEEDNRNRDVPFVMVTSLGDKEYVLEAAEHGVTDYVTKPFNNEQLSSKVTKYLVKQGIISKTELAEQLKKRDRMLGGGGTANVLTQKQGMPSGSGVHSSVSHGIHPAKRVRGKAMLLFGTEKLPVMIRELSTQEVVLMLRTDMSLPAMFQKVTVGFLAGQGDNQQRLSTKGSVIMLQALEKRLDAEVVYAGIRFTDLDDKSQKTLSRIIGLMSH
ncbi:response regulator [Oceanospirillum sediminis]|uniref:Response regulator n=1 Tax=Oceanospirillum sediminis TaxID=2760088 RepID=A0A839IW98_9GAMM|nr:response regulator [Oceanospirillum sediminis]MBB1488366.1 response regulator [Oceanospirillum sediminis]